MINKQTSVTNNTAGVESNAQKAMAGRRGFQVYVWSLAVTTGLAFAILATLIGVSCYVPIATIVDMIEAAAPWLTFWRIGLFLLVIGGWPHWSTLYAAWAGMDGKQLKCMMDYRWRMALWLLIMELVLSHGVIVQFVDNLSSLL